jgi:hypothetical protein
MRKGENLSKENLISISDSNHRVIIPLYIPIEDKYYKDAYRIFEYCLFSSIKTSSTLFKVIDKRKQIVFLALVYMIIIKINYF